MSRAKTYTGVHTKENRISINSKYDSYLILIGAIVRQAMIDYATIDPKGKSSAHYNSAKHYLFSSHGLEDQINRLKIPLNIGYVRKMAKGGAFNKDDEYVKEETQTEENDQL